MITVCIVACFGPGFRLASPGRDVISDEAVESVVIFSQKNQENPGRGNQPAKPLERPKTLWKVSAEDKGWTLNTFMIV